MILLNSAAISGLAQMSYTFDIILSRINHLFGVTKTELLNN